MSGLKELISKSPVTSLATHAPRDNLFRSISPNCTMRRKCKPSLGDQSNNAGPVEYETRSEMGLHIVPVDVINND
jgi:hypothetical protein